MSFRTLTLYLARHGECEHNADGWIAGQDDSPLTARGRAQARDNGVLLAQIAGAPAALDFFASPLHRTAVSMELLREAAGLPPTLYRADRRLMEQDYGALSRRPVEEMRTLRDAVGDPWAFVPPGGESFATLYGRTGDFLAGLTRDAIILAHAGSVRAIRGHVLGLSPEETMRYHMPNAGLLRLSMGSEAAFGR